MCNGHGKGQQIRPWEMGPKSLLCFVRRIFFLVLNSIGSRATNLCMDKTFGVGCASGLIEVSITHPIDYCKVCLQKREAPVLRRCYAGVTSRWCSVLPMRGVLWTAKQHGAHMHHKSLFEKCTVMGSMCGAIQSVVDCPIENVKLQKMAAE